jgi:hypothetical protein
MNAELSHERGYEKHEAEGRGGGNSRNGKSRKKLTREQTQYTAVLRIPPVLTPLDAVRAAIAAQVKNERKEKRKNERQNHNAHFHALSCRRIGSCSSTAESKEYVVQLQCLLTNLEGGLNSKWLKRYWLYPQCSSSPVRLYLPRTRL